MEMRRELQQDYCPVCQAYTSLSTFIAGAALDKPSAVLPPAMQEAIMEEMEAKHAHKHGGKQASRKQLGKASCTKMQTPCFVDSLLC